MKCTDANGFDECVEGQLPTRTTVRPATNSNNCHQGHCILHITYMNYQVLFAIPSRGYGPMMSSRGPECGNHCSTVLLLQHSAAKMTCNGSVAVM